MDIDIERLEADAAYWDELKAPEDATHACIYLGGKWQWMKVNLSGPFNYYWHRRFSEWQRQESEVGERIIPRPQKPEAEWDGEGLPPVGCECEMQMRDGCIWEFVVVQAYSADELMVMVIQDNEYINHEITGPLAVKFRPILTKEQRQRDELESIVSDAMIESAQEHSIPRAKDISSAVISAGWKKDA